MGYSLEVAEKSVATAATVAQPMAGYLEKPINYANDLANNQLDKLELKVPLIAEPSEKIVSTLKNGAWDAVEKTTTKGTQQMNNLMTTKMGKIVTASVYLALGLSEIAIDHYLPEKTEEIEDGQPACEPDESAQEENMPEFKRDEPFTNSVIKVTQLSDKVRRRMYQKALNNIQYAQKRSEEALEKLKFTLDLIEYAKTNMNTVNQAVREKVSSTQETLWTTWDDWTTDPPVEAEKGAPDVVVDTEEKEMDPEEDVISMEDEEKTLAVARNLLRRLTVLTKNISICVKMLPQNIGKRVEDTRHIVEEMYGSFKDVKQLQDIPLSVLASVKIQLNKLSTTILSLSENVMNSSTVQWLVPNDIRQYVHQTVKAAEVESNAPQPVESKDKSE